MRANFLGAVIASALLTLPIASQAQTTGAAPDPAAPAGSMENRYGRSPHCEPMTGAEKEQCLRDEASKTQGSQPDDKAPQGSAGGGSTSPEKPVADDGAPKSPSEAAPSGSGSAGTGAR